MDQFEHPSAYCSNNYIVMLQNATVKNLVVLSSCVPVYVFNQLAYLSISTGNALGVPARQVLGFIKSPLNTEIASTGCCMF